MHSIYIKYTSHIQGSFSNADGAVVTIGDCHILFAFYNVGKVSYNWTGVRTVELDTEN